MDDPHALSTGVEVLEGYSVVCYNPVAAATGEEESSGTDLHSVQLASSTDTITVDCRVWTATLYTAYSCNVTCISDHYLLLTLGRRVTVVVLSFYLSVNSATENSAHFFVPVKVRTG